MVSAAIRPILARSGGKQAAAAVTAAAGGFGGKNTGVGGEGDTSAKWPCGIAEAGGQAGFFALGRVLDNPGGFVSPLLHCLFSFV
jgi:hypothetical protein